MLSGIRTQLIAFSVGIFGITLLLFSSFLYQVFVTSHAKEFDADLLNYTIDVAYALDVDLFGQIVLSPKFESSAEKLFPFELGDTLIQLRNREGLPFAHSRRLRNATLPLADGSLDILQTRQPEFRNIDKPEAIKIGLDAQRYRLLNYYFEKAPGNPIIVQVAAPIRVLDREKRGLLTFFSISIPFVLIAAIFGGIYLSRKAMAPVMAMIDKTRRLSAQKLSDRLPVPHSKDEIQELALTLNGLFDRLEEAFRGQQTFVSDASHQLKTPLAILRGEIDLMRSRPRTPEEVEPFLQSASEEVGYLSRMIEDLLVLARIDVGARGLSLSPVHLDETLVDIVGRLNRIAAPKHVDLILDFVDVAESKNSQYTVDGDSDLLRSLFEGIIENSIKYSRAGGGKVFIQVKETGAIVSVSVRDEGIGIAKEALPKIFDRFYRSGQSSNRQPGSGLGLAIAKRIIEVHEGTIRAESNLEQGTEFLISLKKTLSATA
jgi:signal transduction histidine kinase